MATSSSSASAARWGRRWPAWQSARRRKSASSRWRGSARRGCARNSRRRASRRSPATFSTAAAVEALPKLRNVIFMAGLQVRRRRQPGMTWAMNVLVPAFVAEAFKGSRIVAFSTGCVYPFAPSVTSGGSTESDPPDPPGEYAISCLGRERMFEYYSRLHGTPGRPLPAQLRHRPSLRRAARHRHQGARRQAARRDHGTCQCHLAGRRVLAGAPLPQRVRDADRGRSMSAGRRSSPSAIWPPRSACGSASSRSSPARNPSAPG